MAKIVLIEPDGSHVELGQHNIPTDYRIGAWIYPTFNGVNARYKVDGNDPDNDTVFVIHDSIPQTISPEAVASV